MLYFISYAKPNGFGSYQLKLDKPIRNISDIHNIENRIMKYAGLSDIAILYWRRFEEDDNDLDRDETAHYVAGIISGVVANVMDGRKI